MAKQSDRRLDFQIIDPKRELAWTAENIAKWSGPDGATALRVHLEALWAAARTGLRGEPNPQRHKYAADGVERNVRAALEVAALHLSRLFDAFERGELAAAVAHALRVGRALGAAGIWPYAYRSARGVPRALGAKGGRARAAKRAPMMADVGAAVEARHAQFPRESWTRVCAEVGKEKGLKLSRASQGATRCRPVEKRTRELKW